jgi:hypothetical protein
MFAHTHFFHRCEHTRGSLAARGGLARTFGSLACFLALSLLGLGVYILVDTFANPIAAQAAAILAAAFIIALASIILFYLFKPRGRLGVTRIKYRDADPSVSKRRAPGAAPLAIKEMSGQLDLPHGHPNVGHARVRL